MSTNKRPPTYPGDVKPEDGIVTIVDWGMCWRDYALFLESQLHETQRLAGELILATEHRGYNSNYGNGNRTVADPIKALRAILPKEESDAQ